MTDAREALVALIRTTVLIFRPEAERLADAILAAGWTPPGEGDDAELRAEVERLRLDLDVARANRENVERDWREAREQVADLRAGIIAVAEVMEANPPAAVLADHARALRALAEFDVTPRGERVKPSEEDVARQIDPEAFDFPEECAGDIEVATDAAARVLALLPGRAEAEVKAEALREAADCNCGFGGQHDPANPRCRANRAAARRMREADRDR